MRPLRPHGLIIEASVCSEEVGTSLLRHKAPQEQ